MVTGLAITTLMLAALNAWVAFLNYKSQTRSENRLNDMNKALNKMEAVQRTINERELRWRQDRARMAVHTLTNALCRQASVLRGQWTRLSDYADPLEPVRAFESELSWIPDCDWKEKCIEVLNEVRPLVPGQGSGARSSHESILSAGCQQLQRGGDSRLYEMCLDVVDHMA